MEELKSNKQLNVLKWIFVIVTLIHIIYATVTMRGMYMDGSFFMVEILNKCSEHIYKIAYDNNHCRMFILSFLELPTIISSLFIKNKFALMMIFSFTQLALPVLALWLNYRLTKRTLRYDVLFWNLFCYGTVILLYMMFSITETIIGVILLFILWNYLVSKINYTKKDIFFILILITIMFESYEYISYIGLLFFIMHFYYVKIEDSKKNKLVKSIIGFGSLFASVFNIIFIFKTTGNQGEIVRFVNEATSVLPHILSLNSLISVFTIILLLLIAFKKNKLSTLLTITLSVLYAILLFRLLSTLNYSLDPMYEGHFRTFPCIFLPIIFIIMFLRDLFNKDKEINYIKYSNCICVVLLCSISLTIWQLVDTYFWNENIKYMQTELKKEEGRLYIPFLHEEISSFYNPKLRRYLWHVNYVLLSILFSKDYEQKVLLLNYDYPQDIQNRTYRENLFVYPSPPFKNIMNIPYDMIIHIKNKYWDLTKCAQALDEYNKQNNIKIKELPVDIEESKSMVYKVIIKKYKI